VLPVDVLYYFTDMQSFFLKNYSALEVAAMYCRKVKHPFSNH